MRVASRVSFADLLSPLTAWTLLAVACVFKVTSIFVSDPVGDEAYYWIWSYHPAWSYFDHPPMIAVLNFLSRSVFGDTILALRLPSLVTAIGIMVILRAWCLRIYGADGPHAFLVAAALFFVMPGMNVFLGYATPDHLLLFLSLLSLYLLSQVLTSVREKDALPLLSLYGGALALGLAGLTKYYAVFIGLALLLVVAAYRDYRALLRSPHVWLAGLFAIACQTPVLIWNIEHHFASFAYHLVDRQKSDFLTRIHPEYFLSFAGQILAFTSPAMFVVFWRFLRSAPPIPVAVPSWQLARWVLALSLLVFTPISLTGKAWGWWIFVGLIAVAPFLGSYIATRRLLILHIVFGLTINLLQIVSQLTGPVTMLVGISQSPWEGTFPDSDRLAAAVAEVGIPKDGFVASAEWADVSMIGFLAKAPDAIALPPNKVNAFGFWQDLAALKGKDALIFVRKDSQLATATRYFEQVELKKTISVERFGKEIKRYRLYIGTGFKGELPP